MDEQLELALSGMSQSDFQDVMALIDPISWTEQNRTLKGKPFSFIGRDYLLQPYRDDYQDIIFYKGRQVEMSEFSMNWLLRKLYAHPYTAGLHAFPRDNQAHKFSKQRLDASINDSKKLKDWYVQAESEQMMRKFVNYNVYGDLKPYNFYIMGATWESRKDTVGDAARSVSLDFIVYDERQDHPDDVETVLGEGASHSEYGHTITLGTPKLPGTQFDQQWEASDKHKWFVTCKHCGRKDPITMNNILETGNEDGEQYYYGCPECKNPIDRLNGEWLPTNPQKHPAYRGYHINQLMVCWISADKIMKKYNSPTYPKRRFYNEVLGIAYGGDDIPITQAMMTECTKNDFKLGLDEGAMYAGIDWGSKSYLVLQNKTKMGHKLVDCMVANDTDGRQHAKKFAKFLKKYAPHVKRVVCDAGPDISRFYALRDELKALGVTSDVWACYYTNPPAKVKVQWNEAEHIVSVGRSEAIDLIIDELSDQNFIIPGCDKGLEKIGLLMDQFTNISAVRSKTQAGVEFMIYQDTGPDHFLHAKLYSDIASRNGSAIVIGSTAKAFSQPRNSRMNEDMAKARTSKINKGSGKFPSFNKKRGR